jgi:hypothetical protein
MVCMIALVTLAVHAQQTDSSVSAPIPAQIPSARRVFISNGGVDPTALSAFQRENEPNKPYNRFYAEMKKWGRYELVGAPGDADLVFEIRFTAPISDCDKTTSYNPGIDLLILDAKTHFVLWTFRESVGGAFRKTTWDKNFDQGMSNLIASLKQIGQSTVTPQATQPGP